MRSVLVTGGTGFFGRAFVRRVLDLGCERVCVFSRDEHAQAEMRDAFGDDRLRFFVGDVRDRDRLRRAFRSVDTVVHAAALKRIEVGRYNPIEMVKTNVIGATNVIEAAEDSGDILKKVIALSSDKAYQPVSAYGQSKALMESLMLAANDTQPSHGPCFSVVRYGNVIGSTGSVVTVWRRALANGGRTVRITDPDCTRFWMTVEEAVSLVLEAIVTMPREVLTPELPAFRLGDLAEAMGARDLDVTGLPPWEKKHEGLSDTVSSATARRMDIAELRKTLENV